MQTVDIHTHLLAPSVRFDRLFDRVSVRLFARRLGQDPRALRADPFGVYRDTMARLIGESRHVRQAVLFGVDARCDEQGREVHRDRTVCTDNEAVWDTASRYPGAFIPFFSVNPLRPDAPERIDAYAERGFRGPSFFRITGVWISTRSDSCPTTSGCVPTACRSSSTSAWSTPSSPPPPARRSVW
jgi:predicted TIM-barrel fold metal-dependent hydrolase